MKNIGHIVLNFISLLIAVTGALMSMDAQVHAIGVFSPKISLWWPVVLGASACVNRLATIIKNLWGDLADDGQINNSYPKKLPLILAILLPVALLSGCAGFQSRLQKDAKDVVNSTDFNLGVTYGGVTATAGRSNGRNRVGVDVDAKEIVRVLNR